VAIKNVNAKGSDAVHVRTRYGNNKVCIFAFLFFHLAEFGRNCGRYAVFSSQYHSDCDSDYEGP